MPGRGAGEESWLVFNVSLIEDVFFASGSLRWCGRLVGRWGWLVVPGCLGFGLVLRP